MIKFFKQMHPSNRFYYVNSILLNWLIGIVFCGISYYLIREWWIFSIAAPLSFYIQIVFTNFYVKKYFIHEEQ